MEDIIVLNNKEISTNVAGDSQPDYMKSLLKNQTRGYTFMTFDGWRVSLGKNNGWGKKVFFETMENLQILCKTPTNTKIKHPDGALRVTQSSYLPCKIGAEKFPELFVYDFENHIWGFDGTKLHTITEDFLEEMEAVAEDLRIMYKEEAAIKSKLARAKKKREDRKNGEV